VTQKHIELEFSRPFAVDRLGSCPVTEVIRASAEECAALARRLRVVALAQLSASVTLQRTLSGLIHVSGRLEADVVQNCVITLADFPSHVEDGFAVDFGDAPSASEQEINVDIDYDPPEPIEGGAIDIGELVAQYLSLALDPHPRSPGAALDPEWVESEAVERSPFAVLKKLKTPN
jgi:uncharacterized metal-binding protein YceD (DUF177 family)